MNNAMHKEGYFYLIMANIIASFLFIESINCSLYKFIGLYSLIGFVLFIVLTLLWRMLPKNSKVDLPDTLVLCLCWPTAIIMTVLLGLILGISLLVFKISDYESFYSNSLINKANTTYNKIIKKD